MKKRIFLCHPYSHPDPAVMRKRFESANDLAARLIRAGYVVFSPISHSVPIADCMGNHQDHGVWCEQDDAWLALCDEVWIPLVPGWRNSKGIAHERCVALMGGVPVKYFTPEGEASVKVCSYVDVLASIEAARPGQPEDYGDGEVSDLYP
jgi:hypothetical protein